MNTSDTDKEFQHDFDDFHLLVKKKLNSFFSVQYQASRSKNWICTISILAKVKAKKLLSHRNLGENKLVAAGVNSVQM